MGVCVDVVRLWFVGSVVSLLVLCWVGFVWLFLLILLSFWSSGPFPLLLLGFVLEFNLIYLIYLSSCYFLLIMLVIYCVMFVICLCVCLFVLFGWMLVVVLL